MKKEIMEYYHKEILAIQNLDMDEMEKAIDEICRAYERDANIYIFGNGGSSATASHFASDFNKGISEGRERKFRMVCLSDNTPVITAIANDIDYSEIYRFQLEGRLCEGDLVIAISGSGNSRNVVNAVEYAKSKGIKVIGITGYDGGKLRELSDFHMHVNVDDMQIVEDLHMTFDHMMYRVLNDRYRRE